MFFAAREIEKVEKFWLAYFMMTTNMKDYFLRNNGEIRKIFRDTMEGQLEHDLYIKSFSNQLQSDETDILQRRIIWITLVIDRWGPIPNNVYEYSFNELFGWYQETIDPEMQDLAKILRDRQIIQKK